MCDGSSSRSGCSGGWPGRATTTRSCWIGLSRPYLRDRAQPNRSRCPGRDGVARGRRLHRHHARGDAVLGGADGLARYEVPHHGPRRRPGLRRRPRRDATSLEPCRRRVAIIVGLCDEPCHAPRSTRNWQRTPQPFGSRHPHGATRRVRPSAEPVAGGLSAHSAAPPSPWPADAHEDRRSPAWPRS
jgi:hypothetical protein